MRNVRTNFEGLKVQLNARKRVIRNSGRLRSERASDRQICSSNSALSRGRMNPHSIAPSMFLRLDGPVCARHREAVTSHGGLEVVNWLADKEKSQQAAPLGACSVMQAQEPRSFSNKI